MYENVTECTPTPSLISIADSSTTDNSSDYQMNVDNIYMMDDDEKTEVSYPIICGLDVAMNNNDNEPNINIEARVQSKVSLSEPGDFMNPRIGRDGQFEFGLSLKNKNNTVKYKRKYEF
eukprot:UN05347